MKTVWMRSILNAIYFQSLRAIQLDVWLILSILSSLIFLLFSLFSEQYFLIPFAISLLVQQYKVYHAVAQFHNLEEDSDFSFKLSRAYSRLLYRYDPTSSSLHSLKHFKHIQNRTECLYAKHAKVWGSPNWDTSKTIEDNIKRSLGALVRFTTLIQSQYPKSETEVNLLLSNKLSSYHRCKTKLDGFVFEIQNDEKKAYSLEQFADIVRCVLQTLSDADPAISSDFEAGDVEKRAGCMARPYGEIGRSRWHFTFMKEPFFITTFSACYPETSSRYAFGAAADSCFVLLQPELSFLLHNLPSDTPHTNWLNPKTVRDKIRTRYRDAGRGYYIPSSVSYPCAELIVPPLDWNDDVVKWWIPRDNSSSPARRKNNTLY